MKDETIQEVSQLFQKVLTVVPSENPKELYADHVKIRQVLEKISAEQDKFVPNKDRASKLPAFLEWAKNNNIKFDNSEIKESDKGFSLIAKEDIPEKGNAVEVPRSAILTSDSSKINKGLRELFLNDQLVQSVENCSLVLLLAHEYLDPKSHWTPYLDILPGELLSPLTMTNEQLLSLKPSNAFILAMQFFRCIARHYVYFFLMTHARESARLLPKLSSDAIKKTLFTSKNFSFDLYVWCTAIVTSRVNRIPNLVQIGNQTTTSPSLIPIMDFANFEFIGDAAAAQSEVFYSIPHKKVQLLLHRNVKAGTEILIPIGNKSNRDCFLYSGFVPLEDSPVDIYELRLGFPQKTEQWKLTAAQRMGVLNSKEMAATFVIHLSTFYSHQLEFSAFWNFAKLFVAKTANDFNTEANIKQAREYLLKRFTLYLEGYKTLPKSEPKDASSLEKYIWRLKRSEQKNLEAMVAYFEKSVEEIIKSNGTTFPEIQENSTSAQETPTAPTATPTTSDT
uniref:protein-histidine N-methyltransferase n=1 Tax=Panagrolaimus superbus TaxID=310955 RepID=A0A914XWL7_9BILA